MTDDDLLRRFVALKFSSTSGPPRKSPNFAQHVADAERKAQKEQDDLERIADGRPLDPDSAWGSVRPDKQEKTEAEGNLVKRQAALNGDVARWGVDDLDLEDGDDDDVEAFLASLSGSSTDKADSARPPIVKAEKDANDDLSREANELLRQTRHLTASSAQDTPLISADTDDEVEDGETEQEILERALAEAEFEAEVPRSVNKVPAADIDTDGEASFAFPSLPTHQPIPGPDTADQADPEADARMALLLGLSGPSSQPGGPSLPAVPTSKPTQGRQPGQGWNLPGYEDARDEDMDSWCCICNQDGTLQCAGCDDDIYCDECWRDGHGPGGEQGHRARRFTWKRKGAAQGL